MLHSRSAATRGVGAVAIASAVVLLAGCSGGGASKTAPSTPAGATGTPSSSGATATGPVGVSIPLLDSPFWKQFSDTTTAQFAAQHLNGLAIANANNQETKQISDIQTFLTQGAKGIELSPVDGGAVSTILATLQSKNIPVIAVNDSPSTGHVAMVVQANNTDFGAQACKAMAAKVQSGSVVDIQGDTTTTAAQQRTSGFEDCMKKSAPNVKLLHVPTKWDAPSAANGLQTLLGAHSDIKGIYMQADGVFLAPVESLLQGKGLLVPSSDPKHVVLIGIDGIPDDFKAVKQGFVDAVIAQPVDQYATLGLKYLTEAMAGQTFHTGPTDHGTTVIQLPNGNLQDVLQPLLVTTANLASVYSG